MHDPRHFQRLIEERLTQLSLGNRPPELYDPIRYMLELGGKRMRPALLLMANELFGGNTETAIGPALGIEVFHNFTLLHDDIMDKAPLRRSQPTVHTRWNNDIAILSGDTMFVRACQLMMQTSSSVQAEVLDDFFKTAIEVCEGQQLDMNFETQSQVSIADYIEMIRLKTAVLLGCSLRIGARIAGASIEDANKLYDFGTDLGIAFQLHDDLLDAYGDPEKFGKQVGGDIMANKKTFLMLSAIAAANNATLDELNDWLQRKEFDPAEKVEAVKRIFEKLDIRGRTQQEIDRYFYRASAALQTIPVSDDAKAPLQKLSEQLMVREH
jgi:geranylgeranyl diphosphate synthase type II